MIGLDTSGSSRQPDAVEPERLTEAERVARQLERADRETAEQAAELSRRRGNLRDKWLAEEMSRRLEADSEIKVQPASAYALPPVASRILAPELLRELERLLAELRALNDSMSGFDRRVAHVLLGDDELASELRQGFALWAECYVVTRVQKPSPRDDGNPVPKFRRLMQELLPWLDTLAYMADTTHGSVLSEVTDYLPWLLMKQTWGSWLEFDPLAGPLERKWRVRAPTPEDVAYCQDIATLYAWPGAQDAQRVVQVVLDRRQLEPVADCVFARQRLATLAAEIHEVRPFLVELDNPDKSRVEVAPNLWASWRWAGGTQLGLIPIHEGERRRLAEQHSRTYSTLVSLRHDGLLASEHAPWIRVGNLETPEPEALAANLVIVEAIHERILGLFAKVDLVAVYDRVREAAAGEPGGDAPSAEDVAATFVRIAGLSEGDSPRDVPAHPRVRIPTLRLERFLAVLERLGCEVRQGKGSEVVAYRHGGKIARIGRHTRNREVPSTLVQRVLHQVGVTLGEWVAALR